MDTNTQSAIDYGVATEYNRLPASLRRIQSTQPPLGVAWTPIPSLFLSQRFRHSSMTLPAATLNRSSRETGITASLRSWRQRCRHTVSQAALCPHSLACCAPSIGARNQTLQIHRRSRFLSANKLCHCKPTLKAEYQYVHGVKIGRTTNINLLPRSFSLRRTRRL